MSRVFRAPWNKGLTTPPAQRFMRFVLIPSTEDGCMEWSGSARSAYYGRFWDGTRRVSAHRFSYELFVGPIPAGLVLDHLCRSITCVRPDHLEPVTQKENLRRGMSPSAINARKETCSNGHPYKFLRNGQRRCVICTEAVRRRRYARSRMLQPVSEEVR